MGLLFVLFEIKPLAVELNILEDVIILVSFEPSFRPIELNRFIPPVSIE
jgi:hypothetical protein